MQTVVDVPAERFKEGILKFATKLSLVVCAGTQLGSIPLEVFDQIKNGLWHHKGLLKITRAG